MKLNFYNEEINRYQAEFAALNAKDKRLSLLRLVYFIVASGLIILGWSIHWILALSLIILFLISFSRLLVYHEGVIAERKIATLLIELNQNEIQALNNDYSWFDSGVEYENPQHLYTRDLDIFGHHSIFQMLCRCTTSFGKDNLAYLLHTGLNIQDVTSYQSAIKELEPKVRMRQRLFAIGKKDLPKDQNFDRLYKWINGSKNIGINKVVMYSCLFLSWVLFFVLLKYLPWTTAILGFIPNGFFLYMHNKKVSEAHEHLDKNAKLLKSYSKITEYIEEISFYHPLLKKIQSVFSKETISASKELNKLSFYLRQLDVRSNFFGIIANLFFLWEDIYILKVEKWKKKNQIYVSQWFDNLGRLESVSSIANFGFSHPEYCYPVISKDKEFISLELGHPLLPSKSRVSNDFEMKIHQHIKIVTGSNMGGKSTFLRAVGVNMILAYCGSKVCAQKLQLPRLKVISSMRTQDNLQESTSSFYAELKRLKSVLDEVKIRMMFFF